MKGKEEIAQVILNNHTLKYFTKTDSLTTHDKDIVPGVYEGGFILWECTIDMLKHLQSHQQIFQGKRVIEMGCGQGLLGILAAKMGASAVCLQDYNIQVINQITKTTVHINGEDPNKFQYLSGDWSQLKCQTDKYDIIIGSQLTYSEGNYIKVVAFVKQFMHPEGICILGNKHYYFGVGGNMPGFKKVLQASELKCQSLAKLVAASGGNKKQIVKITF